MAVDVDAQQCAQCHGTQPGGDGTWTHIEGTGPYCRRCLQQGVTFASELGVVAYPMTDEAEARAELAEITPPSPVLFKLAERNPAPQQWYDEG